MIATTTIATSTFSTLLLPGGLAAGILNVLFAMMPDFYLSFLRAWITIASFLGLRGKPRSWGVVYDSVTKRPLDPVYVSLRDEEGREVATTISGLDGRYGFMVPSGAYEVRAHKSHYRFPSERLAGLESDILYNDLYFGGPVMVGSDGLVAKNIPLDPLAFDWNQFAKKDKGLLRFYAHLSAWQGRLVNLFFTAGFLVSVLLIFLSYKPLNIAIAVLYVAVGVANSAARRSSRLSGLVAEGIAGWPVSFAIVRVLSLDSAIEIAHAVCDQFGRYYLLVPPGTYLVRVEKKNQDGSYSVAASRVLDANQGIIKEKFRL